MERESRIIKKIKDQGGITAIIVAMLLVVLLGVAAFAIDFGHIFIVKNELQNAADAGALAGARILLTGDGTVNEAANQRGFDAARDNKSEKLAVEVNWSGGNSGDVERGHWSFGSGTFNPSDNTSLIDLWDKTTEELDADPNFINAVRVRTHRVTNPAAAFFARIFGYQGFGVNAAAVAYLGYAGTLTPFDVDQPIAICRQSILLNEEYTCTVGRMINSGGDTTTQQTGGWTSFSQDNPCQGGTNANEVKSLVCGEGNPETIELGKDIATSGGEIESAFDNLRDCWRNAGLDTNGDNIPDQPWNLTLPVIDCQANNIGPCEKVTGAVNLNIIWITEKGTDSAYNNVPRLMTKPAIGENPPQTWTCAAGSTGVQCWDSFVAFFNLQVEKDGGVTEPANYLKKSIYFLPDCTPHEPAGTSHGENYGIRAKIPVLVK